MLNGNAVLRSHCSIPIGLCRLGAGRARRRVEPEAVWRLEKRRRARTDAEGGARGEPWAGVLEPVELHHLLRGAGFNVVEDLGASEIA